MNPYIILVPVPPVVAVIISLIVYYLGLRIPSSIGLGIFCSLLSIIIIHPFHLDGDNHIDPQVGDFYTALYILVSLVSLISLGCYIACTNKEKKCCEKRKPFWLTDAYKDIPDSTDSPEVVRITIEPYFDDEEFERHREHNNTGGTDGRIEVPGKPGDLHKTLSDQSDLEIGGTGEVDSIEGTIYTHGETENFTISSSAPSPSINDIHNNIKRINFVPFNKEVGISSSLPGGFIISDYNKGFTGDSII
jgi:hypothetical protein